MDSVMVEALVEARCALEELVDYREANELRVRRDLLERAACLVDLHEAPRSHVIRLAELILAVRDEAVDLRRRYRTVAKAVAEAMD